MVRLVMLLIAVAMGPGCAARHVLPAQQSFAFTPPGTGLTFDAAITRPDTSNGWGVLLIGGGLANDLDWQVPAEFSSDPSAPGDAVLLANGLAERGYTVLRWSTLAREDPLRAEYPMRATPRTHDELIAQASAALDVLHRAIPGEGRRVFVVGHSLGAVRALQLARDDARMAGAALLAGARLGRRGLAPDRDAAGTPWAEDIAGGIVVPVLYLEGGLDRLHAGNGAQLAARVPGLRMEMHVLPGLGHTLAPESESGVGSIAPEAVNLLADWANRVRAAGG